jgi:hypothetical protein
MAADDEGDEYTLGLLLDLRTLACGLRSITTRTLPIFTGS